MYAKGTFGILDAARLASSGKASHLVVARLAWLPGKLACLGKKILTSVGKPKRLVRGL
jgi:hypothetical protein